MNPFLGAIMVGGSLTCLGGAIHGKRLLTIIASFVMTISMIDLAFTNVLSPIFWMMLLVASVLRRKFVE